MEDSFEIINYNNIQNKKDLETNIFYNNYNDDIVLKNIKKIIYIYIIIYIITCLCTILLYIFN